MTTDVERMSCSEIEPSGYFHLSYMAYDDRNAVTEKVSTPAQVFKHFIES